MRRRTSTASSAEARSKRLAAFDAAAEIGYQALVASTPPTVRWLLCGRGRPVDAASADAGYTVVLTEENGYVAFPDIEAPRVAAEERFEELGYERVPYPWHEGPEGIVGELADGRRAASDRALEPGLAALRRALSPDEAERLRSAGADAAAAVVAALDGLSPDTTELEAAAALARQARARGFFPPVVLVAGDERQKIHRHPLPTDAPLGRHALLALTAEREGLHISLTRILSFGPPPAALERLVRAAAEVDAAMLRASRPGTATGTVLAVAAASYAERGFPEEWRRHHQGGITGYRGREVFAVPGEPTPLPDRCAVAWNPSITGGAKSEDTALVTTDGIEVVTRTPALPEVVVEGLARPSIVEL